MKPSQRLLAAFLLAIIVLSTLVVFSVDRRVRERLRADVVRELQGEAWLVPHEQQGAFAATIVANTKRMQRLVDDLLDLSRIESGGVAS